MRSLACVMLLGASGAWACPAPDTALPLTSDDPGAPPAYAVLAPPPLSAPFALEVGLCTSQTVSEIGFDAVMPAHQHGMNFRVDIEGLGANLFVVRNVVFHMPGLWEMQVDAQLGDARYSYSAEIVLE